MRTDGNGYYVAGIVAAAAGGTVRSTTASKGLMVSQTTNATVLPGDIVRYDFVLKGYTATALNPPSPNPACAGTAVSLTATVTGTNGPTGSVEFFDGAISLGTATLSGGSATKSVSSLSAGTHSSITATYLGDGANSSSTSSSRSVTVNSPPTISGQPTSATNDLGSSVTFTVTAANATAYQWRKDGTNISGAILSSYTINPVGTNDAASYDCVVSGTSPCASVTSAAAILTVPQPPVITTHPRPLAAVPGSSATFTVSATGFGPLFYQWYQGPTNGLPLAGRTAASLTLTNVQPADFADYSAVVSNAVGSATSTPAPLTMALSPTIAAPGFNGTAFTLTFSTEVGPAYRVEYKYSLDDPSWQLLTNLDGAGSAVTVTDPDLAPATKFYRIQVR